MGYLSQAIVVFGIISAVVSYQPTVHIPGLGSVVGTTSSTAWSRRPIYQFLGIKYAKSPRGVNRFQLPEEIPTWDHVLDATRPGPACPTFTNLAEIKDQEPYRDVEDCLSLSIYTPSLSGRYPVMFYIHGEFFFDGSSEEAQPNYLLEKDVVLVAVQYRLAPIGFLSTRSKGIPGNIAAMDVLLSLDWVQKHIRHFGGDDNEMTVFGQGSGATLAHLLMITPLMPEQIFRRAILQSGSMLSPYFLTDDPIDPAMDIARQAKCPGADTVEAVNNCLTRLTTSQLIEAFGNHAKSRETNGLGQYGGFQWTIGDPFGILPYHPSKLIRQGENYHYPVMGGVTKNVGSYFFTRQILKRIVQRDYEKVDVEELVDIILRHSIGEDDFGIWKTLAIENLFEPEQIKNSTLGALLPGLIDLISNIMYKGPVLQALQMNSKYLANDTFLYTFDYHGRFSRYATAANKQRGVSLSDDNLYLFPFPPEYSQLNAEETSMARKMVDLWTSFAITGIPESDLIEDDWPPMTLVTGPYLAIDSEHKIGYDFIDEMVRTNQEHQEPFSEGDEI